MNRQEIIDAVNQTFVEMLEIPKEDLSPEKGLFTDLGLDSLDTVDLMIGFQRKSGISLSQNGELKKATTMNDLYDFFEKMDSQLQLDKQAVSK